MELDCVFRNAQASGNFLVPQAAAHESQHFPLSRCELFYLVGSVSRQCDCIAQHSCRRWMQEHITCIGGLNRKLNLVPVSITRNDCIHAAVQCIPNPACFRIIHHGNHPAAFREFIQHLQEVDSILMRRKIGNENGGATGPKPFH